MPWQKCKATGKPDVLTGSWKFIGVVPDTGFGKASPSGSVGGTVAMEVMLRWTRTFKREYCCCKSKIKWSAGVSGYMIPSYGYRSGPFIFFGAPGGWTPIPTGADLAEWFFNTAGAAISFPNIPQPGTDDEIENIRQQNEPKPTTKGSVVKEPSEPTAFCWW